MNKITYAVGSALAALYLAVASPLYANGPTTANGKPEKIEVKVHQASPGIESLIDGATIQHGFFQGKYRVDADLMVKNAGAALAGPLSMSYSLCFTDGESSACVNGRGEQLPGGLPSGELKRKLSLPMRFPTTELEFQPGKKTPLTKLKPKINVQLKGKDGQEFYSADHYLPPVQEYKCKDYCPG